MTVLHRAGHMVTSAIERAPVCVLIMDYFTRGSEASLNPCLKQMLHSSVHFHPLFLSDHLWALGPSSEAGGGKWIKISKEEVQ